MCEICFSDPHRPDLHVAWNYHRRGDNGDCASCGKRWICSTAIWWQRERDRASIPQYAENEYAFFGRPLAGTKRTIDGQLPTVLDLPEGRYIRVNHATLGWSYAEADMYWRTIPGYHYA